MNMESNRLDELAARFWEGACSEAEELELRKELLCGPDLAKHSELRSYIRYLEQQSSDDALGDIFNKQILQAIEQKKEISSSFPWMKMAAGIALFIGLFFTWKSYSDSVEVRPVLDEIVIVDTYDDPEVAYREVKKALMMMGGKMNEGASYAGSLYEFEKAKNEIEKDGEEHSDQS
jgi:hypothetical protein